MRIPISVKLTIIFAFLIFLIGAFSLFSVNLSKQYLEKIVVEDTTILAKGKLSQIDENIYSKIESLRQFTANSTLRDKIQKSNLDFEKEGEKIQEKIITTDQTWTSLKDDEVNDLTEKITKDPTSQEIRETFLDYYVKKHGYKVFQEVFITNRFGANIAQTQKTSDYYQADEEWWQKAKEEEFYVSQVEYDDSASAYVLTISVKIDDKDGNFIGVIKGVVDAEVLIREVEIASLRRQTSEFKLLTKDGKLIYSTNSFRFLENYDDQTFLQKITRTKEGSTFLTENGKEKLVVYSTSKGFRYFKGLEWILLTSNTTQEVFSSVTQLRNNLLGGSILLMVLGLIGTSFFSSFISKTLNSLSRSAQMISSGKMDVTVPIVSNDELADVARAFNKMSSDLQKSYTELESRVKERTLELQKKIEEAERINSLMVGRELRMKELKEEIVNLKKQLGGNKN